MWLRAVVASLSLAALSCQTLLGIGDDAPASSTFDAAQDDARLGFDAANGNDGASVDAGLGDASTCPPPGQMDASACVGTWWNGRCYFLIVSASVNAAAAKTCEAVDAHLATVTCSDEWSAVRWVGQGTTVWLGATRIGTASYTWATGEPFSFAATWADGGPDASNGECVVVTPNQQWLPVQCGSSAFPFCETR